MSAKEDPDELLDDLESIRELLEDEARGQPSSLPRKPEAAEGEAGRAIDLDAPQSQDDEQPKDDEQSQDDEQPQDDELGLDDEPGLDDVPDIDDIPVLEDIPGLNDEAVLDDLPMPSHLSNRDPGPDAEDVPVLEDRVAGKSDAHESPPPQEVEADSDDVRILQEDTINALMSDEWKHSTDEVLSDARAAIDQTEELWLPKHTDELIEALKVRIDSTVDDWLAALIAEHVDELRDEIASIMRSVTQAYVRGALDSRNHDNDG